MTRHGKGLPIRWLVTDIMLHIFLMMIVFIKAINRQTAVNTMQNILTC